MNTKTTTKNQAQKPDWKINEQVRRNNARFQDFDPLPSENDHAYLSPLDSRNNDWPSPTTNTSHLGW
ncbi:hypothetical protein [Hymenobacter sp. BT730]|uniref:hypothetical protein n=1 Tax=Hymenobacter sp. BT730 TaxID=3063332 RepID=UPI0026DF49CC|nr:hypothetical protein [Hymenobacter sp. BT730]